MRLLYPPLEVDGVYGPPRVAYHAAERAVARAEGDAAIIMTADRV